MNTKLRKLNKHRCFQHYKPKLSQITFIWTADKITFKTGSKSLDRLISAGPSSADVIVFREDPYIEQIQDKARENANLFYQAFIKPNLVNNPIDVKEVQWFPNIV